MCDYCWGALRWAWEDEAGASLVEYILLVFLIAMVCVSAVAFLGFQARRGFVRALRGLQNGSPS